jgi:asparagine synthetase B (glutamine-hydrolysing)
MNLFLIGYGHGGIDVERGRRALGSYLAESPFFDPPVEEWRSADGNCAALWIQTAPVQTGGIEYVACDGDMAIGLFSGRPIFWANGRADGRLALEADFYLNPLEEVGQALDGRFVAARYVCARAVLEVLTDPLGSHAVYATEVEGAMWVSTRPDVLRRLTPAPIRQSVVAEFLAVGWSMSGQPIWSGVDRLPPGCLSTRDERGWRHKRLMTDEAVASLIGAGFNARRAAADLVETLRALNTWPGRPGVVSLSGGRDSRVVFAAACAGDIACSTKVHQQLSTSGEPQPSEDVEIALALGEAVGRSVRVEPVAGAFNASADTADVMRLMSSGAASLADAIVTTLRPIEEPLALVHTGQGGELARAYYGHQPQATFGSRLYRTCVPLWPPPIVKRSHMRRIRRDFDRWVASHGSVYVAPGALGDAFYLRQRSGHWQVDLAAVHEATGEATFPLWTRRMLPHLLGLPYEERRSERFFQLILEELEPRLLDVPFEGGQPPWATDGGKVARTRSRPWRAAEKAVRLGRRELERRRMHHDAEDPFENVLSELRPAWPMRPRFIDTVVRVRAAERRLSRSTRRLDARTRAQLWRLATLVLPKSPRSETTR